MDVDEEDDNISQRLRKAQDHGIEVDFAGVGDDDLAVCTITSRSMTLY